MLSIYFGKPDNTYYGPAWFMANYEEEWLSDPLVQDMLRAVDKSEYKGGRLIDSDVLGPISPSDLSGGVKTLICIYKRPDLIFNATSCGPNCARWLLEVGKRVDVTIALEYCMRMDGLEPFSIRVANTDTMVHNCEDYTFAALDILNAEDAI